MDFKEFREKAKAAGLAVDQHSYKGKQFVFLLTEGAIAIPAGSESLHRLFAFAEKIGYELRRKIEDHHASSRELGAESTPIVWQPFEGQRAAFDIWNDGVVFQRSSERMESDVAPQGRIFLKDWLA